MKSRPMVPNGKSKSTTVVLMCSSSAMHQPTLCDRVEDPAPPRAEMKATTRPIGLAPGVYATGTVIPLELAHLPYKKGCTYEEYIGLAGLERRGKKRWRRSVLDVIERLKAAFVCDYVLLGGGNAKLMRDLPPHIIVGANENAILGGLEIWNHGRRAIWTQEQAASGDNRTEK